MAELEPFCGIDDVEVYYGQSLPANLTGYATNQIGVASNVLRRLFLNEGRNLDGIIAMASDDAADGSDRYDANLTKSQVREAVAANVAHNVKRMSAMSSTDQPLDAFSQFSQSAGGYTFSGTWQGDTETVFFTQTQLNQLGLGRPNINRVSV